MNSRLTATLGGLMLLAVTVAACGSGSGSSNSPAAPTPTIPTVTTPAPAPGATADVIITITGMNGSNSYSPSPATVKEEQTVAWRNADSVVHTATADNGAFNTGNIGPGATSSVITMSKSGSFNYHCAIHPEMVGTLNVTNAAGGY